MSVQRIKNEDGTLIQVETGGSAGLGKWIHVCHYDPEFELIAGFNLLLKESAAFRDMLVQAELEMIGIE